ncbi:MAG: hypothetical protein WBN10_06355, partial [Polyangiales bacterium]
MRSAGGTVDAFAFGDTGGGATGWIGGKCSLCGSNEGRAWAAGAVGASELSFGALELEGGSEPASFVFFEVTTIDGVIGRD